jgi:spore maturation protein CgeB
LTAVYDGDRMQDFFTDKEVLYYHDVPDLVEKLMYLQAHDEERMAIAAEGRARYHEMFSGERILNFMLETLFNRPYSSDYEWTAEIYR